MKNILSIILSLSLLLTSSLATAANKATLSPAASPSLKGAELKPKARSASDIGVWLYSLDLSLYQDLDQDGFHQNMRINLDLDTNVAYRDVIIQVWLNAPEGGSELVFETLAVTLIGDSYSDAQQIDIQFIEDYNEDYYDVEVVIIDVETGQEIFYVDGFDDERLAALAIEGQRYDQHQDISIYSADIELFDDDNNNGFYHQLSVAFDVDVPYGHADLIAQFYIDGELVHTSHQFSIVGNSTTDKQTFNMQMHSGLRAGYYDLDIHILNADDLVQRHHISAVDWVVFDDLPLESYYWEHYNDHIEVGVQQTGGTVGYVILGLGLLIIYRRKIR